MRAGLYARVSTEDQHPENQILILREYAARREWEFEEFVDHGLSGSLRREKRPQLDRLLNAARYKKIDIVVCWKLDRFARSLKDLVDTVEDLRTWNVQFTTLNENIDTSTANGKLVFHIFAALAEFELSLIKERINLGIKRAQSQGTHCGRPIDQVNVEVIKTLREAGKTFRAIEAETGINRMKALRTLRTLSRNHPGKRSSLS